MVLDDFDPGSPDDDFEREAIREEGRGDPAVVLTRFDGHAKPDGRRFSTTWPAWFRDCEAASVRPHDGRGWAPATFARDHRSKATVEGLVALAYDLEPESKETTVDPARLGDPHRAADAYAAFFGLVHTSRSHRTAAPRCRVVLPTSRPITAAEHAVLWPRLGEPATRAGLRIDPATKDPSRFWYLASLPAEGEPVVIRLLGRVLPVDELLAQAVAEECPPAAARPAPGPGRRDDDGGPQRYARRALEGAIGRLAMAQPGTRNPTLAREAYGVGQAFAAADLPLEEARHALRAAIGGWDPGYMAEHEKTLERQLSEGARVPRIIPERREATRQGKSRKAPPPPPASDLPDLDDLNAIPPEDAAPRAKKPRRQPQPGDFERGDHVELAGRMLAELGDRDDLVGDEGRIHRYRPSGLFEDVDRGDQSRIVQGFAGTPAGEKGKPLEVSAGDVAGAMRLAYDQVHVRDFFAGAPSGLAFANGFASVSERAVLLRPHARENRARAGYPFAFDASARPSRWLQFLSEVFATDHDQAQRIAFLREWLGAALLGLAPRWELALVLLGGGANGKSTFIRIVSGAMPAGSTCAIPPQLWGNEYRLALMRGCRLNIVAELPTSDILASESFKAIISGDEIDARAIREAPFKLRAIAGHLFAANALPGTRDLSDAFWRRLVVLRFSQTFDASRADTTLAERILAEELPAIVAWMLTGASSLLARGRFEVPASSQAEVEAWKRKADAVALFVSECTADATDSRDRITCADFYARFRRWAEGQGFQIPTSRTVGERMAAMGKGSTKSNGFRLYPVRWRLDSEGDDVRDDAEAGPSW